jgi:hypothetical protein
VELKPLTASPTQEGLNTVTQVGEWAVLHLKQVRVVVEPRQQEAPQMTSGSVVQAEMQ